MHHFRQLVLIDQALHGRIFVLVEFWGAFLLAGSLATLAFVDAGARGHLLLIGTGLAGISANYLLLGIYALTLPTIPRLRRDELDMDELRRMTKLSLCLVIPFAPMIMGLVRKATRHL